MHRNLYFNPSFIGCAAALSRAVSQPPGGAAENCYQRVGWRKA